METLYERIGGQHTIEQLVTAFYQRVLADPMLKPFFEKTSISKLKKMQMAFFEIALGAPDPQIKTSLRQAHAGRGIQTKHLSRFTEHLIATLGAVGVKEEDAKKVYERIATYSNDVLGETTVDG